MKKLLCLLLVMASLLSLCACGLTEDKIKERLKALEDDKEITYEIISASEMTDVVDLIEDEMKERLDGDIKKAYTVFSKNSYHHAIILIFEELSDAKLTVEGLEEIAEKEEPELELEDAIIHRDGKIVIVGDEDVIDLILEK